MVADLNFMMVGVSAQAEDTEMKKKVARSIVGLVFEYGGKLNDSMLLVRESAAEDEFSRYRRAVGNVLASTFENILDPIFAEHPDLRPNRLNLDPSAIEDPTESQ